MGRFNPRQLIVFDVESTGLRYWHGDQPFAVALSDEEGETWYTEWRVDPFSRRVLPNEADVRYLNRLLGKRRGLQLRKVGFNTKFDWRMLRTVGVEVCGPFHDAGIALRVVDTLRLSYKLKTVCEEFGIADKADESRLQKEVVRCRNIAKKRGWNRAEAVEADYWLPRAIDPSSTLCEEYAVSDVFPRTLMLWLLLERIMKRPENRDLWQTYCFEMLEVWPTINKIEDRPIRIHRDINTRKLQEAISKKERQLIKMNALLKERRISWSDKPVEFNPGSAPQLARVLYDEEHGFGLTVHRRSEKTGDPSTDWKALREHLTHPFVQEVVIHRSAEKEASTYFGNYDRLMLPGDVPGEWILHQNFNQLGAAKTCRLSSHDPNFQNVGDANNNPNSPAPIQAREPFGPRDGYVWFCLDWSGQEMRIFAASAQIETMLHAFATGQSIHEYNANLAWGGKGNPHAITAAAYSLELGSPTPSRKSIADVWKEIGWNEAKARLYGFDGEPARQTAEKWLAGFLYDIIAAEASIGLKRAKTRAKNLGFAKIYGAGINGVIDMLYCTRQEARAMLRRFDDIHPGMPEFMADFSQDAKRNGYCHNLFGRRLNVDPWYPYKAVNYHVQSTAADMMKRAMVKCVKFLEITELDWHLLLSIHDELVFEAKIEQAHLWVLRQLRNIMECVTPPKLGISMPVECSKVERYWHEKVAVEL